MNYCYHCGMKLHRITYDNQWEARYRCDMCALRMRAIFKLAGGSLEFTIEACGTKPFDCESEATEDCDLWS